MSVVSAQLISPDNRAYVAWGRRRADIRRMERVTPPKRNMGEKLGWIAECAARHHLSSLISLQEQRIMQWQVLNDESSRISTRYREIDAIVPLQEGFIFYEIKLTTEHRMMSAHGLTQLRAATKTYREGNSKDIPILLRLVYIADTPVQVLNGKISTVPVDDLSTSKGVIWITPDQIEAAASHLGLELPSNWFSAEARNMPEDIPDTYSQTENFLESPFVVAFRSAKSRKELKQ